MCKCGSISFFLVVLGIFFVFCFLDGFGVWFMDFFLFGIGVLEGINDFVVKVVILEFSLFFFILFVWVFL